MHLLERFAGLLDDADQARYEGAVRGGARRLRGRVIWTVSSSARGGGVAEMMRPLVGYARGAGADARWLVIEGTPAFFEVTKRLHHLLHGDPGDGGPLGAAEREVYEGVLAENAAALAGLVAPGDVVLLHDPQTAGLAPAARRLRAIVVWRSHIGCDDPGDPEAARGWRFLLPYVAAADAVIVSRAADAPPGVDPARVHVMRPSIDPFTAKNAPMDDAAVPAVLAAAGLLAGPGRATAPVGRRDDGSPLRVCRRADVVREGGPPPPGRPLVVQVSRWDRLKDHLGVMEGFARMGDAAGDADLVLAGPAIASVADDPDGPAVMDALLAAWRALPARLRRRVHVAALPMEDGDENAAIVNALQRHAAVVVQKSLREGFGLTVTEAMCKGRPVVASAVGGIRDQITDGLDGVLVDDPRDLGAFAGAVAGLLADPARAAALGRAAHERARRESLNLRQLADYAILLGRLVEDRLAAVRSSATPPEAA